MLVIPIVVILLAIGPTATTAYRWSVIDDDITDVCNNRTCADRPHSVCLALSGQLPSASCAAQHRFKWLRIGPNEIRRIVDGHNGLRNRVARSHFLPVSDMNVLHWDRDLETMAAGWIGQCIVDRVDDCQYIYDDSYSVGQNIMYLDEFPRDEWEIKIVRSWYLQGNTIDATVLEDYRDVKESNYTQLIWSSSQFVGCAAAQLDKGYVMACNYSPKGNVVGKPVNRLGDPCTHCELDRPSCSGIFRGLCGLDASSTRLCYEKWSLIVILGLRVLLVRIREEG